MLFLPRHDHSRSARLSTKETLSTVACLPVTDRIPETKNFDGLMLFHPQQSHTLVHRNSTVIWVVSIVHVWHIRRCHEPLQYVPDSDPSIWLQTLLFYTVQNVTR